MPAPGPDWSVSPEHWGARVDYDEWSNTYQPTEGMVLHHGGGGNYRAHLQPYSVAEEQKQLRAWEAFHIDGRGWQGIAYNWGLGQSGNVYRLRGWNRPGAHTGDMDSDGILNNTELGAVLFIGSGNYVPLSADAQSSLVRLRSYINETCQENFTLYGHQEASGNTSCPGPNLMVYVKANRLLEESMPTIEEIRAAIREETPGAVLGAEFGGPVGSSKRKMFSEHVLEIADNTAANRAKLAGLVAGSAAAGAIVTEIGQRLLS